VTLGFLITKKNKRYNMKYLGTAVVADMRGSLAGTTASKNRYANYFRTKVSPVNPNTSAQAAIRQLFTSFTQNWSALLTATERDQWTAFAAQHAFSNVFGQKRFLDGKAMYIGISTAAANAGLTYSSTPPTDITTGETGHLTLVANSAAGGTLTLATVENNVPAGAKINVYATSVLPAGKNYVKSELRYIGTYASGGTPYDLKTNWETKYGTFPTAAGGRITVAAQVITAEGWLGTPSSKSHLVI
jgi:hypothetical protein